MRRLAPVTLAACLALAACGGHSTPTKHAAATAPLYGGRTHSTQFVQQAQSARFAPGQYTLTLTPSISGYDAVTISAIPRGAAAIGCYVSGPYANCATAHADFPSARLVTIATSAGYAGPAKLLDTEPGDATPNQDAGFIRTQTSVYHVYRPGVYADASEMTDVRADLAADGLARSGYVLMIAAWDGNPAIPSGYDAKQWRSTPTLDYDTFATSFFAPTPAPKPKTSTFAIYPPKPITLYGQKVSERRTVERWWSRSCANPVKRSVCKTTRTHLEWFAGRLVTLAEQGQKRGEFNLPPDWSSARARELKWPQRHWRIERILDGSGR